MLRLSDSAESDTWEAIREGCVSVSAESDTWAVKVG